MRFLLTTLALLLLAACNTTDERLPELLGSWEGVTWMRGDEPVGGDPASVTFSFREDYTYDAAFGGQVEQGSFVFRDSKVYTTATGDRKVEKVVAVEQLAGDTLVFDMNRSGTPEKLTLVRR